MPADALIDIFRHALYIVMMVVGLIVTPGLIIGLLVSMFQAATQINEMTISFLPKLFVILFTIALLSPWLFKLLVGFTQSLILDIPFIIN